MSSRAPAARIIDARRACPSASGWFASAYNSDGFTADEAYGPPFPAAGRGALYISLVEANYGQIYADLWRRHWWWRAREGMVLATLRGHPNDARSKILDVGCGDGLFWDKLRAFGSVEGIEPDERLVSPDNPDRDLIEVNDFLDGRRREKVDLLLMLDVLEHIENEEAAVSRARDLLLPGGQFVLTVPAFNFLWSYHDVLNGHFRRYTKGRLARALEKSGFEVISMRYCFVWMLAPLLVRKLLFRKPPTGASAFTSVPPKLVNWILQRVSAFDCSASRVIPFPAGGSIIAVARLPEGAA